MGGEKVKDKKKEVCEKWHTSGMNEKREEKKHAHNFSQKARFSLELLKKHNFFLSHVNDKSVFGLQSE